jgi:LPXTG-site transpeptidase (sortase) family protein
MINSTTTVVTSVLTNNVRLQEELEIEDIERQFVVSEALNYGFGRAARRLDVLTRALALQQQDASAKSSLFKRFRRSIPRVALISLAVVVLGATGYVGFDTWHTNDQAKAQLGQTTSALAAASTDTTDQSARQTAEGTDEKPLPHNSLKNYVVAASLPRAIYIDKLHVAARTLPMDVNPNGSVQAPLGIYDAGWYTGSVKPGEIGAMFIDGHASGPTQEGLFGKLHLLAVGDTLQVEKGDGTKLTYKVVHTALVDKDAVDMHSMLLPYGNATRALNLMTCAGKWVEKGKTLSQRVLVYTEQI